MRRVVALGGGHGTAVVLRAARRDADLHTAFEHRVGEGDPSGLALGNLVLVGTVEPSGNRLDGIDGIDGTTQLPGAAGRAVPATDDRTALGAKGDRGAMSGQVAPALSPRIDRAALTHAEAAPTIEAAEAAASKSAGQAAVLRRHGLVVDVVLADPGSTMECGPVSAEVVERPLSSEDGLVHDPVKLADALSDLLASRRPHGTCGGHDNRAARCGLVTAARRGPG